MKDMVLRYLLSLGKAVDAFDIADALAQPIEEVTSALNELIRDGRAVLTKKGRYISAEGMGLMTARTVVLRSGAPVARPVDGGPDMMIRKRGEMRPMVDDLILVHPDANDPSRCELYSIVRRAHEQFSAVVTIRPVKEKKPAKKSKSGRAAAAAYEAQVQPVDGRITAEIQLDGDLRGARSGDVVLLKVIGWPARGVPLKAKIHEVLGAADNIRVQLSALAVSHGLTKEFPDEAMAQANALPTDVTDADRAGRTDLTDVALFTIDGDDAKDFDDAVSLTPIEGGWRLGVHIADVSHYVRRGTPIDREAVRRGTSVYLPGLTLPMLPEALSNRLCSLMPRVDRLAMSLMMDVKNGSVADFKLHPAVIHSAARLTYAEVNHLFEGQPSAVPEPLRDVLRDMLALSKQLREKRRARGSIDFDMAEPVFTLDADGHPTDVRARARGEAERLIEDFMLLANETVAEAARSAELPFLYRVHGKPDPDRLRELQEFLAGLNHPTHLSREPHPSELQKILDDAAGSGEAALIKQVMLRSLKRASYSEKPEGHFGLAARDYCHFTSPIRRYPDLEVHRMLKLLLTGAQSWQAHERRMPDLAKQCSACEYAATLAERDADDLLKAHYMAGHIGEVFNGVVSGVTAWGFYVTLENTVEGLVHVRTLEGEYRPDQARHLLVSSFGGRGIRLGDSVRVTVDHVNASAGEVDFTLVGRMPRIRDRAKQPQPVDAPADPE